MGFGKEIRRLREGANMPASKLASLIGIDAERLRKWEQKDLTPKDEDTIKIEKFFGMPISQIEKLASLKKFLNVPSEGINQSVEISKLIGEMREKIITLESSTSVLKESVQNLIHAQTGKSAALISAELDEAISMVSRRKLDELRRKG